ncbi:hypothetical protein KIN20_013794 [Parelaphostrongylus tenuis]|uniref:Uncharacterized protein n=1 Tax=Parelaphostrongylus tenuis TaxID=148309 RepID=A0AAD5QNT0_PARTN|nr:hypothetical protein KIN20_013794 [Parelaphostrongylus tenuis]
MPESFHHFGRQSRKEETNQKRAGVRTVCESGSSNYPRKSDNVTKVEQLEKEYIKKRDAYTCVAVNVRFPTADPRALTYNEAKIFMRQK